jgi:hypothetical protein
VHAEQVCHLDHAGFTPSGLRPMDALARDFREAVCQFRFARVSATEVERVDLTTGTRVVFGAVPVMVDGVRQHMHVAAFVQRRQQHPRHGLFGAPGAEQWYGGREDRSSARLDLVWQAIEAKTPQRESDQEFQHWPAGTQDLRSHLMLAVDEFDDGVAATLVQPETEDQQTTDPETGESVTTTVILQRRLHRVDIQAALGLDAGEIARVRNRNQPVDLRAERAPYTRTAIVTQKVRER